MTPAEAPSPGGPSGGGVDPDRLADEVAAPATPPPSPSPSVDHELLEAVQHAVQCNEVELEQARDDNRHRGAMEGLAYRSPAWTFVLVLRPHPLLVDLTPDAAADAIEPCLEVLRRRAELPHPEGEGVWAAALGEFSSVQTSPDPLEDFLRVWRLTPGSRLEIALVRAGAERYADSTVFGEELAAPRRAPFRRFLALALELHRLAAEQGEPAFPLPVQRVAEALGSDRRTVAGWRTEAAERGFIQEVRPYSRDLSRAAEYTWIATRRERIVFEGRGPFA